MESDLRTMGDPRTMESDPRMMEGELSTVATDPVAFGRSEDPRESSGQLQTEVTWGFSRDDDRVSFEFAETGTA